MVARFLCCSSIGVLERGEGVKNDGHENAGHENDGQKMTTRREIASQKNTMPCIFMSRNFMPCKLVCHFQSTRLTAILAWLSLPRQLDKYCIRTVYS